jgi:DNA-binding PadR family transcriptional regulator
MLEEMGYVTFAERDGKKVYTITTQGLSFLAEQGDVESRITSFLSDWQQSGNVGETRRTMHEFSRLAELLNGEVRKADTDTVKRVRGVIAAAYRDIEVILNEAGRSTQDGGGRAAGKAGSKQEPRL